MAPSSHWHPQLWPVTTITFLKPDPLQPFNERSCIRNFIQYVSVFLKLLYINCTPGGDNMMLEKTSVIGNFITQE